MIIPEINNLPFTNAVVSIKRRTITSGIKKGDVVIQENIPAFIEETGSTGAQEQLYLIMLSTNNVTSDINNDTDTIYDGTNNYKIENTAKKENQFDLKAIKVL